MFEEKNYGSPAYKDQDSNHPNSFYQQQQFPQVNVPEASNLTPMTPDFPH